MKEQGIALLIISTIVEMIGSSMRSDKTLEKQILTQVKISGGGIFGNIAFLGDCIIHYTAVRKHVASVHDDSIM